MVKYADQYFKVRPWSIVENGFDPRYSKVAESVFSLANEHAGLRGYFDEGYSGSCLQGSYINGIYESRKTSGSGYKGMLSSTEFMVNTVDWVYARIMCNGRLLDLARSSYSAFSRTLDLRSGELVREFIWHVDGSTDVKITFSRFLSMHSPEIMTSRISWLPLKGKAEIIITAGLDFSRLHVSQGENFWDCRDEQSDGCFISITGTTRSSRQTLFAAALFDRVGETAVTPKLPTIIYNADTSGALTRIVSISKTLKNNVKETLSALNYETLLDENRRWWQKQWALSDIEIDGDEEIQQGIRYCIFQLHQTIHTGTSGVFGAKGLTGEVYGGNTFWDTETYCLPFYIFQNPKAAYGILQFRYDTLNEAKNRAGALDCAGAFYPIATISGRECCDLWQHANTQLQASTAVAYGIWHYTRATGDRAFLTSKGIRMLVEICRMLATRGDFDPITNQYGYYGVMGPDEFQLFVNHNTYTNYMGKKTFLFTLDTLAYMLIELPEEYAGLVRDLSITNDELTDWRIKAEKTRILYSETTCLYEQHDGFFHLPHIDITKIPVEEFPLYSHWAYDRLYRNDMIKQPDVLMFMFMYPGEFDKDTLAANFDYYEPRCIHESSLSPSVHSVLASRLGRHELAYDMFRFAARLDLDDYNRNTGEGLHATSIAGSWINIVYGFAGLRSDKEILSLNPVLPTKWTRLCFRLIYRESVLSIEIDKVYVKIRIENGAPLKIEVYGVEYIIPDGKGVTVCRECLADREGGL